MPTGTVAVLNGLLGEQQAEFAFVTGGEETPLGEPSEEDYAEAESRSTLVSLTPGA